MIKLGLFKVVAGRPPYSSTQAEPHDGVSAVAGSAAAMVAPTATASVAAAATIARLTGKIGFPLVIQRPCPHTVAEQADQGGGTADQD
jgi:hypothetical protein